MTDQALSMEVKSADDIMSAVRDVEKVLPVGSGTKPALSECVADVLRLDMLKLTGIVEYEPAEYTISALAGTTIDEMESELRVHNQYLPFDPVFVKAGATAGGTVASGLSGSGRLRYGGIRDFILGTRFVDGKARLIRGGGKVVKNAAGFDFPKLLVGSMGRLGIMVDVTFKVFPSPPAYRTLLTNYRDVQEALADLQALTISPIELNAADLQVSQTDNSYTLATRIGGASDLLSARSERLIQMLPESEVLEGDSDAEYWSHVSEFDWADYETTLVKIPISPARIPAIENVLARNSMIRRYSVAGNLLFLAWRETVGSLHKILAKQQLTGVLLRGDWPYPLIGANNNSAFVNRIAAALDPGSKFLPIHPV